MLPLDWLDRNSTKIAGAGIAFTFLTGLVLAVHAGPTLRYPDEREWIQLAANLASRHAYTLDGVHLTAFRPPAYPLLLAAPLALGIHVTGLRVFNLVLFLIAEIFLYLLARRLMNKTTAAIAVLLVLLYPVLTYTATLLVPQTLAAMLILVGMWLLMYSDAPNVWAVMAAGVVWGMLLLAVPPFLFVLCGLIAWLCWKRPRFRARGPAFLATFLLVMGIWTARNYRVFHTFVFGATSAGINFLQGNSDHADSFASVFTGGRTLDLDQYASAARGLNEAEQDKFYKRAAYRWIEEHPARAANLYVLKLAEYFKFAEQTATQDFATRAEQPLWRSLIMLLTYGPLLLLFLWRIVIARRHPLHQLEALLVGLYLLNAPFAAIFYTRIRYRLPMDWLLILFDASAIYFVLAWGALDPLQVRMRKEPRPQLIHAEAEEIES